LKCYTWTWTWRSYGWACTVHVLSIKQVALVNMQKVLIWHWRSYLMRLISGFWELIPMPVLFLCFSHILSMCLHCLDLFFQKIYNFIALGSAVGFRLDSLLKLTDTRARNNKITLMHYLCKVQYFLLNWIAV